MSVPVSLKRRESGGPGRGGENFKVAVRVRPLIDKEIKTNASKCVQVELEHSAVVISKPESRMRPSQIGIDDFGELVRTDTSHTHNFFFDTVFGPASSQEMLFDVCARDIVESVLQGYNGSIIASGQTGSGKTYTIEGLDNTEGIIPRATERIFSYIANSGRRNDRFLVRASFLEIYNERISDLMDPSRENLKIREDGTGGVFVEGLSEHIVRNTSEVMRLMRMGTQLRTTAATRMNKESSRSHAMFTIVVEHAQYSDSGGSVVTIGKLRMVDLAGSERLDVEAHIQRQEETKNINVSLHTFSKVVTALTTPGVIRHVPYRDSKLTRLLQDCLGGNCKTSLIATITPIAVSYTESLNTLKFAKRAKNIKNTALINKDVSEKAMLSAYQQEIKKLRQQLSQRDSVVDQEELERLEKERTEAQKEKAEVLSRLEAQRQVMSEVTAEREQLLDRIAALEQTLLHGGSRNINESEEFKKALQQSLSKEHDRMRRETESHLESKLAELEAEKKRLQDERTKVMKEKEYFVKLREELKPDGQQKEDDSPEEIERGSSPVKTRPRSSSLSPLIKTPRTPSSLYSRPPPSGAHIPTRTSFPLPPRRINSSDMLYRRPLSQGGGSRHHSLLHLHSSAVADYDRPYPHEAFMMGRGHPLSAYGLHTHIQLDDISAAALQEYAMALAHPLTGIPCQDVSGVRIFNGSSAVKWFMQNMQGVTTMQAALSVGQRLMDLTVFTEIQGATKFVISDSVYYQFCDPVFTGATTTHWSQGHLLMSRPSSSLSMDPYSAGSHVSLGHRGPLASASGHSSWSHPSTISLAQSVASLQISGDLLEHFGLSSYFPSQLHVAALYGDRSKVKLLAREVKVDCLDTVGHTPLMYAVMGKQPKCCLQLIRLGADVNAANHSGQTSLLLATAADHSDIIKLLLKSGAQTHFVNQEGQTAFHIAAKSQNYKCLEYLCKYAAVLHGINERDHLYHTPLHDAVLSDLPSHTRRLLIAKADLGVSDENGRTALHYAVSRSSLPCAQVVVETTPNDINLVDTSGWSALHLACQEGSLEMIHYLFSSPSCDINLKDQSGQTPLHIAVLYNRPEVARILVHKGTSITSKDKQGKTALCYSMELGFTDCGHAIQTGITASSSST